MHTRERTFVVRAGLAAAVLACCALTWSSHAGEGKVELFAEAPGNGRLDRIESQMKAYKSKLSSVLNEFHGLQSRQSELRGEEQTLDNKAREVRSIVHHTRNAITSLQYEVHDLRTEELSDSMFGRNHHDADAGGPKHEAKAKAAARLAAKAGMQGEAVPAAAVRVVTASPAKPAQAVAVSATGPAAAQAIPVAVAKHAAPTVLEVAVARAALQRAVVARQQLAVEQKRELRGEELGKGHAGREQQLVAGGGEVYNAQLRANQAQKQAYMRSTEYLQTQEAARRSRRRVYGTGLPQLPLLQPLGPEAAAP